MTEMEIMREMKRYGPEQFEKYKSDAGWQSWMDEYLENPEVCTERELDEIEKIQRELWDEVHNEEEEEE